MATRDVVIVSACRTPIGKYLGGLSGFTAMELGARSARTCLERAGSGSGVDGDLVDEVIMGAVLTAGLGQAPARQAALAAGIPSAKSALTVNMVCGSGLRAVMLGAQSIQVGNARMILAGGMESMSQAPHLLRQGRTGWKFGDQPLIDAMMHDGLTCAIEHWPMGMAAERTATQCGLTRAMLDQYAYESQQRACAAKADNLFQEEIVPITKTSKQGDVTIDQDESPRADTRPESLAKLPPAFRPDGIVTAGNASTLADGAATVLLADAELAKKLNLTPLARIVAYAIGGRDPKDLFLAPIDAVRKAVENANLQLSDIEAFEINEAFAAQTLANIQELAIPRERVNIHGGAIALGHPIGASGARILVTLIHTLKRQNYRYGLAALCLGGGNAVAMIIER